MSEKYRAYLQDCFQGEVLGEALGGVLADKAQDPTQQQKWRYVEQLERETKERIRVVLQALGENTQEDPAKREEGKVWGEGLARLSWAEAMAKLKPALEKYIRYFEKNEQLAPAEGQAIVRHITQHERALLAFTVRELEGQSADSLAPIQQILAHPPIAA